MENFRLVPIFSTCTQGTNYLVLFLRRFSSKTRANLIQEYIEAVSAIHVDMRELVLTSELNWLGVNYCDLLSQHDDVFSEVHICSVTRSCVEESFWLCETARSFVSIKVKFYELAGANLEQITANARILFLLVHVLLDFVDSDNKCEFMQNFDGRVLLWKHHLSSRKRNELEFFLFA